MVAALYVLCAPALAAAAAHADGEYLEEIVVVATKTATPRWSVPAQVTVMERERLDWEQVRDLAQIVRHEPALEADTGVPRFGSSGISIRGVGGNRVALEFDGVPLPQRFAVGNFADASRLALDPAIVKRVEILRGPASALYGSDAIGGVIAMTSVDGHDLVQPGQRLHVGGRSGYYGVDDGVQASLTGAAAGAKDSFVLSASHRAGGAPDNRSRDVENDVVDYEQWQLFGKWTREFDHGGTLRAAVDHFRGATGSDMRSLVGFDRFADTLTLHGDDEQQRTRASAEYRLPASGWLDDGSALAYFQQGETRQETDERRFGGPAALLLERDFEMDERGYGGEVRARREFDTGRLSHVLLVGGEWDHVRLLERREGLQTLLATGAQGNVLLGETFPLRDMPRSTVDETGVYVQDEVSVGPFIFSPGLRWDRYRLEADTDDIFTDPARLTDLDTDRVSLRLGWAWAIAPGALLYAQFAEGFRAPPPEDVNLFLDIPLFNLRALPNPDLKAERSDNIEAGFRVNHNGTVLEASAYHSSYDDFIESRALVGMDPVTGALLFQSRNIEQSTIYGVEAQLLQSLADVHAALREWSFDAGVHWAHGDDDRTDRPLNVISPLKAVFDLYWEPQWVPFRAGLRVQHVARQNRVDFGNGAFFVPDDATVLDLTARWTPTPWMEAHLAVNNLTNARYWGYADVRRYRPDDPRVEVASRPGTHVNFTVTMQY